MRKEVSSFTIALAMGVRMSLAQTMKFDDRLCRGHPAKDCQYHMREWEVGMFSLPGMKSTTCVSRLLKKGK